MMFADPMIKRRDCKPSYNKTYTVVCNLISTSLLWVATNNSHACDSARRPQWHRAKEQLHRMAMFVFNLSRVHRLNPFTWDTRLHISRWIIRSPSLIPSARHAQTQINCVYYLSLSFTVFHPPHNKDAFEPFSPACFPSNESPSSLQRVSHRFSHCHPCFLLSSTS